MRISLFIVYGSRVLIVAFAELMDVTLWYPIEEGSGLYSQSPLFMPLSANQPVEMFSRENDRELQYGTLDPTSRKRKSIILQSNITYMTYHRT